MHILETTGGIAVGNKQTMDENTKKLFDSLKKLRDVRNDRIEYSKEVLKSLNDAFLVKAIEIRFKESRNADIALMAFGLMPGYEYEKIATIDRRYKYLEESDYLAHNPRSKIKTFANATEEEKYDLAEALRCGPEDKRIEWLADFLLDQKQNNIKKIIEDVDNYIRTINGKRFAKLPEPNYLKNNGRVQNECMGNARIKSSPEDCATTQTILDENSNSVRPGAGNKVKSKNTTKEDVNFKFDLTNNNSIEQEENEQKIPDTNNISICEEDERDTSTKDSGIQVSTNADSSKNNLQETFFIGLFPDELSDLSMLLNKLSTAKNHLLKLFAKNKAFLKKTILVIIVVCVAVTAIVGVAVAATVVFIQLQNSDRQNKTQYHFESELIDRGLFNESYTIEKICTSIYIYYTDEETGQKRRTSIIDEEISEEMIDAEVD